MLLLLLFALPLSVVHTMISIFRHDRNLFGIRIGYKKGNQNAAQTTNIFRSSKEKRKKAETS